MDLKKITAEIADDLDFRKLLPQHLVMDVPECHLQEKQEMRLNI